MTNDPNFVLVQSTYHVLIIGCGLGGLAAAIGVGRAGHDVTIIEKAAELQELGAGINISPNATLIFQAWGILGKIRDRANVPHAAFMRSNKGSFELSSQQLGCSMEERCSAPYLVIHRAYLHNFLQQEARRLGVHIKLNCQFTKINFSEPSVDSSSGEIHFADTILGADGERSACRGALLGYSPPLQDSGDHVFRITVKTSDVAQHRDLIHLVQPPCINLWVGPGAHAITYLLKRDDLLNIVLTCSHDISTTVQHDPQRAEIAEAREAFSRWDAKFQALLGIAHGCSPGASTIARYLHSLGYATPWEMRH